MILEPPSGLAGLISTLGASFSLTYTLGCYFGSVFLMGLERVSPSSSESCSNIFFFCSFFLETSTLAIVFFFLKRVSSLKVFFFIKSSFYSFFFFYSCRGTTG